jgi:hypothetical protein
MSAMSARAKSRATTRASIERGTSEERSDVSDERSREEQGDTSEHRSEVAT